MKTTKPINPLLKSENRKQLIEIGYPLGAYATQ